MDVARHDKVEYLGEKWGGGPHYAGLVHVLGEDAHGTWLWGPAGRVVRRGDRPAFRTEQDLVALVPPGAWWTAAWWLGHPEVDLYVNINTPSVREGDVIRYIDLDLDVVRRTDGRCEIVDQDEFAEHQVLLGYPDDVIAATVRTADDVLRSVESGEAPLDGATAREWAAAARVAGLTSV